MLYTTERTTILGLDSRQYSLQTPLIRTGRPAGGWRVVIPVNGQSVQVDGETPVQVYNNTVLTLRRNNMMVSATDIWLNLNIQWLGRSPEKHHIVPLGDLMLIAKTAGEKRTLVVDTRRRSYKPADWGRLAWGWLNLFLAREEFHFRDFLLQLAYVLDMLNPDTNPEIGCAECYLEFNIALSKVKARPGMTRQEARVWLVDFHNSVNKRIGKRAITFDEASKLAYWT